MTSQTPLVTQPASKCLVIGLCSPGFIGGAPTYLCQRRRSRICALLKVERGANDGMRTGERLIWTRPRVSAGGQLFGSQQRAATQQRMGASRCECAAALASRTRATRLKLTCLHVGAADSLWTRPLMRQPRGEMKQHSLKGCSDADENLRLPLPCYIFSWYVKWWGMKSIHQQQKWLFPPLLYKILFWSHGASQESKGLAALILQHEHGKLFFFFIIPKRNSSTSSSATM